MDSATNNKKRVLVCGGGGFIGQNLVTSLRAQGHWVVGADLHCTNVTAANEFYYIDLRNAAEVDRMIASGFDEIYQLAADMGGAGYIFTGENDADIMNNSVRINLNVLESMVRHRVPRVFYSSSACVYPEHNQLDPANPNCEESSAYPAAPDSDYGWEKLFSERLFQAYARNHKLQVRIARFHNVYGPGNAWCGGREKAPAALCRKVLQSTGTVEIWGDGQQTRSFTYIDQCVEGIHRLMASNYGLPVNIGSDRMITINDLAQLIAYIAGKSIEIKNIPGPLGVRGRNSDNRLVQQVLGWQPANNLEYGLEQTLNWIKTQL